MVEYVMILPGLGGLRSGYGFGRTDKYFAEGLETLREMSPKVPTDHSGALFG